MRKILQARYALAPLEDGNEGRNLFWRRCGLLIRNGIIEERIGVSRRKGRQKGTNPPGIAATRGGMTQVRLNLALDTSKPPETECYSARPGEP